jgi:hemerythrin-like metal-binding protein
MSMFLWDPKYILNIPEIDEEHQKLFALFNELYDAMQDGHGNEVIDKVITRVLDYTDYHFAHEELLFRTYGYTDEAAHRAEHAQLRQQATALAQKLRDRADVAPATLKLLYDWLNHHILESDKSFAPFLIRNGVPSVHAATPEPHPH